MSLNLDVLTNAINQNGSMTLLEEPKLVSICLFYNPGRNKKKKRSQGDEWGQKKHKDWIEQEFPLIYACPVCLRPYCHEKEAATHVKSKHYLEHESPILTFSLDTILVRPQEV